MRARTVAVLVTLAFLLGVGGALWVAAAFRAPETSSVDPIELQEEGDGLDERDGTKEGKKKPRHSGEGGGRDRDGARAPSTSSDGSSGGAPVAPPPPPEEAGDDDGEDDDGDDGDD